MRSASNHVCWGSETAPSRACVVELAARLVFHQQRLCQSLSFWVEINPVCQGNPVGQQGRCLLSRINCCYDPLIVRQSFTKRINPVRDQNPLWR